MSEEKEQTLCSETDIDIYIKNKFYNNIPILEGIINNFKNIRCPNPILKTLIKNTINHIKNPVNILQVPKIKLGGSSSIVNLYSKKYNKYIVLLGDVHLPFISQDNMFTIKEYFQIYFQNNTKLIDFFIEVPFYHKKVITQNIALKISPLSETYEQLKNCYTDKNCSFRFHAVDIRMEFLKINTILQDILNLLYYLRQNDHWDIQFLRTYLDDNIFNQNFFNLLLNHIDEYHRLIEPRIQKQINNISYNDIKNMLQTLFLTESLYNIQDIIKLKNFFDDFSQNLENKERHNEFIQEFEKIILPLNKYLINLVDIYTLSRIFRNFLPYKIIESGEKIEYYNPSPKYNILFLGQTHIDNIYSILVNDLDFQVVFGEKRTVRRSFEVLYENLPHKFFNDKDFVIFTKTYTKVINNTEDNDIYDD